MVIVVLFASIAGWLHALRFSGSVGDLDTGDRSYMAIGYRDKSMKQPQTIVLCDALNYYHRLSTQLYIVHHKPQNPRTILHYLLPYIICPGPILIPHHSGYHILDSRL
ncbi:hypothetical protein VTL71DRAFT_3488 [Oculimacula yallundae]|uniref:Uncharacterized protein n=1 Tax=Oculimacula yallundae TaxID=86028 RepID=A0ABR4C7C0_9HELO